MGVLLWIGVAVAALIIGVFVVGRFLPETYEVDVLRKVAATPGVVFSVLTAPGTPSLSGYQCRGVEVLEPSPAGARWREDLGQSRITVTTSESQPERRIVREVEDSVVPMRARWEIDLSPSGPSTRLRMRTRTEVRSGTWHVPIFRVALCLGAARAGARSYLTRLGKALEAGVPGEAR